MARAFSAEQPLVLLQGLEHIAVAHLGTHKLNTAGLQRKLDSHVAHHGAYSPRYRLAAAQPLVDHQVEQLIAVVQPPLRINQLQAVSIAI